MPMPSWKGWLLLFVASLAAVWWAADRHHAFLAQHAPLDKVDVLVVEGWVTDLAIEAARREWDAGRCQWICTSGVDLDRGEFLSEYRNWAEIAAARLRALGVPSDRIIVAPAGDDQRHRTFQSMVAAKQSLDQTARNPASVNVLTQGVHARRSRIVAEKVFGVDVSVGVLALPPTSYDPEKWWTTSGGLKEVVMETIAWAYEWLADSGRESAHN